MIQKKKTTTEKRLFSLNGRNARCQMRHSDMTTKTVCVLYFCLYLSEILQRTTTLLSFDLKTKKQPDCSPK